MLKLGSLGPEKLYRATLSFDHLVQAELMNDLY